MKNIEIDSKKRFLITGCAGFIGYFLSKALLEQDCELIGIDNVNNYYDVKLKYGRINNLENIQEFYFYRRWYIK